MLNYIVDYFVLALNILNITNPVISNSRLFTIINFHRVLPENLKNNYPLPNIAVTPEELFFILNHFKKYFTCGTVSQMIEIWQKKSFSKPLLAISFDDGQVDNFTYALPVLNKLDLKATFYVPVFNLLSSTLLWHDLLGFFIFELYKQKIKTDIISHFLGININFQDSPHFSAKKSIMKAKTLSDNDRKAMIAEIESLNFPYPKWSGMMSMDHLNKLLSLDHEIGSHSMTHPLLDKCSNDVIEKEVVLSKNILNDKLGYDINSFSFPNGNYNKFALDSVKNAGYRNAVTTQLKSNRFNDSLFELGRCDILSSKIRNRGINSNLSTSWLNWRLCGLMRIINNKRKFINFAY